MVVFHWSGGVVEERSIGVLEYWSIGVVEYWSIGVVEEMTFRTLLHYSNTPSLPLPLLHYSITPWGLGLGAFNFPLI
jgi:hypothetical protein